jgi:hypothetical protein
MVSKILHANISNFSGLHRGAVPKQQPGQSTLEYEWELKLHNCGLGMERGSKINDKRIIYGEDPRKEENGDESVTLLEFSSPI